MDRTLTGATLWGRRKRQIKSAARDLVAFMRKNFSRGNLIVGAAGDISPEELGSVLDDIFGVLPESANINFVREADADFSPRSKDIPLTTAQILPCLPFREFLAMMRIFIRYMWQILFLAVRG